MAQYPDGTEYLDLTKPRPVYNKIPVDKSTYPTAEIMQKLAKNRNWQVCTSVLDEQNKRFSYVCEVNAHETAQRYISYDEACKDFHWKKFKVVNNGQAILWSHDPAWDDEVEKIMKRAAAKAKKQKKLEELEQKEEK